MALSDTLKALSDRSQAEADLQARKPELLHRWRLSVDHLYSQIETWLAPHIASHGVLIERTSLHLSEDMFGRYDATGLTIRAGSHVVLVQPVARVIIGGWGRVDMFRQGRSAPDERVLLIRNNDKETAEWLLRPPARRAGEVHKLEPLIQERFEALLDGLLTLR